MSLNVFANEHGRSWFHRGGERVGWADGRAVAFAGFASTDEAQRAAGAAYDALRPWLARQRRAAALTGGPAALRSQRDGRQTRLTLGGVAVGRVLRPTDTARWGSGYGFELMLPPGLTPVVGMTAARLVHAALARRTAPQELESAR